MDKITLETDFLDRIEKASKFLSSLPTNQPVTDPQPGKDISQSRMAKNDISARRKPTEIAKVKTAQPVTDKLEQNLIKEFVNYFE
jgi:SET domain-containing protein